MATVQFTQELADEYRSLFSRAEIRPEHTMTVNAVVDRIFKPENYHKYKSVQDKTGVPAFLVGIIHSLEANSNFNRHLHNGDPLTARTVNVPAGRPSNGSPPFGWDVSAADALSDLRNWADWSVAGIAYVLERYNGWGYRRHHPHVKSPYLWSFTTIYSSGKYVADKTWSDNAVSKQCGGMAALKRMVETGRVDLDLLPLQADEADVAIRPFPEAQSTVVVNAPQYPGRMLKLNSFGSEVELVQTQLIALGIQQVGVPDKDFGDKTEWSVRLFQARSTDETGEPLEIDGVVGPKTWRALFGQSSPKRQESVGPIAGSLLDVVLSVAAGEVGVREEPPGSNRGPEVDQYHSSVSPSLLGQPWCMTFVYWCFARAASQLGVANPLPKTGGVLRSWELAQVLSGVNIVTARQAERDPSLVQPGMVFYIHTGGGAGHTGLVAEVVSGKLVTIEGNTNEGGSRDGIGVFTRTKRRVGSINMGFITFR